MSFRKLLLFTFVNKNKGGDPTARSRTVTLFVALKAVEKRASVFVSQDAWILST